MIIDLHKIHLLILCFATQSYQNEEFCSKENEYCRSKPLLSSSPRYILYDVNYSEGFNLRRDVFMRLSIFMHLMQQEGQDWHLVLPPWPRLYHWHSTDISKQSFLQWDLFFDIESLKRFSPVMEFNDFIKESPGYHIDDIFVLQHFEGAFTNKNWIWDDKWSFHNCDEKVLCSSSNCRQSSYIFEDGLYHGLYLSYRNVTSASLHCVSFQGPASFLKNVLKENHSKRILIDRAEIVVHDGFGDKLYWECRRSMRFAKNLVTIADSFRFEHLGCDDSKDKTTRPSKWENEKKNRKAIGGPYICAHLRRGDFVYSRANQLPSLKFVAEQLLQLLATLKLDTIFLASDGSPEDIKTLKDNLNNVTLIQYTPSPEEKMSIKDGGVAIVDQIICSYARYFIGTYESTFTFRIQEEREIIGFPVNTTFNVFCANPKKCFETSRWTIVY